MASDIVHESDKRQSVSRDDVVNIKAANERAALAAPFGGTVRDVPEAGIYCPQGKGDHGRMLMNLKNGMLECGPCGYQVAAPK